MSEPLRLVSGGKVDQVDCRRWQLADSARRCRQIADSASIGVSTRLYEAAEYFEEQAERAECECGGCR